MTRAPSHITGMRQRADAYWFLASLFGSPVAADSLERIAGVAAGLSDEAMGIAKELGAALTGRSELPGADRLAAEHARLFLGLREGHGPPPPYESLWREDRLLGDSTLAVENAYREAGFQDPGPWGPRDHIACELRFLASLCNAEADAVRADQPEEAHWALQQQGRFIHQHLLAWVPTYCRHLAEQSRDPFYSALARITSDIVTEDARQLDAEAALLGEDAQVALGR